MNPDDDHAHPPPDRSGEGRTLGIPRHGEFDPEAFERAVADLLRAAGVAPEGAR